MEFYKYLNILLFLKIYILCHKGKKFYYINNNDFSIKNSVYRIKNREGDLNLKINDSAYFVNEENNNFLFLNENITNNTEKCTFFYIKDISLGIKLSSSNKENIIIKYSDILDKDYALWKIIPKINEDNQLVYLIQNKKSKKYLYYSQSSKNNIILKEEKYLNKNNEFQIVELYKKYNPKISILLKKHPIDILIKPKDFPSKNINIKQNNEIIRYLIKNILNNISWIRKIFIIISNDKINFIKFSKDMEEKIILVKEKDILGFNFTSDNIFGFNMLKMKKFGLSENFLFLDNIYLINKPLNKSTFFYEENGIILPYLIYNSFYEIIKERIQKKIDNYLLNNNNTNINFEIELDIIQQKTLLFLSEIFGNDNNRFGKKLIQPTIGCIFLPIKMSDIEEINYYMFKNYDKYMNKYMNKYLLYLLPTSFHFNIITFYMIYIKNKYDRKVSKINWSFYQLDTLEKINNIKNNYLKFFRFFTLNKKDNINNKRFLNEKNKYGINISFKEEIENNNKNKFNINDFLLIDFNKIKGINETILNQNKKTNDNTSLLFNGINDLIDKINIVINDTLKYYYNKNKDSNKTNNIDILLKEINYLKKEYIRHIILNIFLFCFIIFFISNKIHLYYKYRNTIIYGRKNKYKKHKNFNYGIFL